MNRLLTFTGVGCLVALLAGCATPAEDPTAVSTAGASGGPSASGSADPATEPTPEAEAEPVAPDNDPATCIHGEWVADNDFFLSAIQEFGDEVQSVTGQVTLRFDTDGTLTTDYQDWQITSEVEGMQVLITRVGTDIGTFSATETALTFADTSVGSTLTVSAGGSDTVFDPHAAKYSDAPYTCSPGEAQINTPDGTLALSRQ